LPLVEQYGALTFPSILVFLDDAISRLSLRRIYVSMLREAADLWGGSVTKLLSPEGMLGAHVWASGDYHDVLLFGATTEAMIARVSSMSEFALLRQHWSTFTFADESPFDRIREIAGELSWSDGRPLGELVDSLEFIQLQLLVADLDDSHTALDAVLACSSQDDLESVLSLSRRRANRQ
jgi:hypothetical protein